MYDENDTTEAMIINSLKKIGWNFVAAEKLKRDYSDVFNEDDFVAALKRLNPSIAKNEDYADNILTELKIIIQSSSGEGLVNANENFTAWLRNEKTRPFGKNGEHVTIKLIDYDNMENNDFVISNQVMYPVHSTNGGKRLDLVLYVNGMPLVVGECKTPARPSVSWIDGAYDIAQYEKSITQFFVPNVLNFATEGKMFRYGSVGMNAEMWGPWHPEKKKEEGTIKDVRITTESICRPGIIFDILRNFVLFASDKNHRRMKIIARYQQYEGANAIVERVRAGNPKKGLIWHFQGSGKSLLMVFAAQKLRTDIGLNNPTVIVVVDRIDLDTQISGTFAVTDIQNTMNVNSIIELGEMIDCDVRKILITTIFKFKDIKPNLNEGSNIIIMVDEAHRTQYGNLGIQMRASLPNAFFFGLTGTPINHKDKNTFSVFGADEDEGGYMSKYSFQNSIKDKATLPLRFEPVDVKLHIDQETLDADFKDLTISLSDEERECLKKKASKVKTLITAPSRMEHVCKHIATHYKTKVEPSGFKAMVVTYDRECCVLYKNELDKYLDPECSKIIMHTQSKGDEFEEWRLAPDEEKKTYDRFRDPNDSLKILIVTSKLITGFDAPILQTMYLDKPLKEHSLLQAICRTNRVYPPNKTHGLIVDYLGLFDRVSDAFDYGKEEELGKVISNLEELKKAFPEQMKYVLSFFEGIDRNKPSYDSLEAAQERLRTVEMRDKFAEEYIVLHRIWEALSPDPILESSINDYKWVSMVYKSLNPSTGIGKLIWQVLGQKTIELIHENISVSEINDDLESLILDEETLAKALKAKDSDGVSRIVEIKLIARMRKHEKDPTFVALGERLEQIRILHEQCQIDSIEFLKRLLELAKDVLNAEKYLETMDEQSRAKAALTELFSEVKNGETPVAVENIVNDIDSVVRVVRFDGWQDTNEGRRSVRQSLRKVIRIKYKIKEEEVFNRAYAYVEMYYRK